MCKSKIQIDLLFPYEIILREYIFNVRVCSTHTYYLKKIT